MDIQRAKEILSTLADGINPVTGEVLPDSDSCNQAEVIRALYAVIKEVDLKEKRKVHPHPENAGKQWTADEDERLLSAYRRGATSSQLAEEHKRTRTSIAARLVRLGEIEERDEAR